jgi:chromosome segregation ATPase
VSTLEEILKSILDGQNRTESQLIKIQKNIQSIEKDVKLLQDDVQTIKTDVTDIKQSVQRIEEYQEESIMSMLVQIKKQGELKDSQIQVLNKRLFEVETKAEHIQQT